MTGSSFRGETRLAASVFCAGFLFVAGAAAETGAGDVIEVEYQNADDYDLDLFAPPGPAMSTLELAPRRAAAPSTPKDFGYDIGSLSGPDASQYGFAISASPYWIGARNITLEEYRKQTSAVERVFARAQASLGGAYIDADVGHAWRFAAAVETQLLDRQDHRFDRAAFDCLHAAWERHRRAEHESAIADIAGALAAEPDVSDEALLEMQARALEGAPGAEGFEAARRQCQDESAARLLGEASWLIGAGVGLRSEQNRFSGFDYDGVSAWTHYRQPLTGDGRFALFAIARGDWERLFDIGLSAPVEADAWEAGGGAALQTTRFRVDLSAAYNERDFRGMIGDDDFIRYSAVADLRLLRGVWLGASIGLVEGSLYSDGVFGGVSVKIDWGDFRRRF